MVGRLRGWRPWEDAISAKGWNAERVESGKGSLWGIAARKVFEFNMQIPCFGASDRLKRENYTNLLVLTKKVTSRTIIGCIALINYWGTYLHGPRSSSSSTRDSFWSCERLVADSCPWLERCRSFSTVHNQVCFNFQRETPASVAVNWEPVASKRRQERPEKTRRATFREDLQTMGVIWRGVKSCQVAQPVKKIVTQCPKRGREEVSLSQSQRSGSPLPFLG